MYRNDYPAGSDQVLVVYVSDDTGSEVDPTALYAQIAGDAGERAKLGLHIVSIAAVPIRHAGVYLGRAGSGYETRIAVAVVYAP